MSGSLYRAVERVPERTPDKDIFVAIPEVFIPTEQLDSFKTTAVGRLKEN